MPAGSCIQKKPGNNTVYGPFVRFIRFMVGTTRFELATPRPPDVCATGLRYVPNLKRVANIGGKRKNSGYIAENFTPLHEDTCKASHNCRSWFAF